MNLIIKANTVKFEKTGVDFLLDQCPVKLIKEYLVVEGIPNDYSKNISYFYAKDHFMIGFLPMILKILKVAGVQYTIHDTRKLKLSFGEIEELKGYTYLPYQREAIAAADNKLDDINFYRGIFDMATNAGKSLVMAGILKSLQNYNIAIVITHRAEIFKQLKQLLTDNFGDDVGVITSMTTSFSKINIAMQKSLINRANSSIEFRVLMSKADVLLLDECHIAKGKGLFRFLKDVKSEAVYFFSGTSIDFAEESDAMKVIGLSGKFLHRISNRELIDSGASRNAKIKFHPIKKMHNISNYKISYEYNIVRSTERNDKIAEITKGKQSIISVTFVDHAFKIQEHLRKHGIKSSVFHSGSEDRDTLLEDFINNKIQILICTFVIKEGVNIPNIDVMVNAGGGKSKITIKQMMIGRAVRKKEGSTHVEIHEFDDEAFKDHVAIRKSIYLSEGFEI